jgi:ABC-2 type transport system permease protein
MNTNTNWRAKARILWAITAKDMIEALKNKNIITLLLTSVLMLFVYSGLPLLENRGKPPALLVYDDGSSSLVAFLENSSAVDVYTYPSEEKMKEYLANGDVPELGLVIPADFDRAIAAGESPELQGYVMKWVSEKDAASLQRYVQAEISQLVGNPVSINTQGNAVYPTPDSGGIVVTAGFGFIFVIVMIGFTMVPHLMVEEKSAHTLEALLVSPASEGQVVIAKALTSLFYCLVGTGIGLVVFLNLVVHWWLALLAIVVGSLFSISLGLLLGTLIENRGQLTLMAWVFIVPLFFPVFLSLLEGLVPETLVRIFRAVPSTVVFNMLRASFAGVVPLGTMLLSLIWVAACSVPVLLVVVWLVRRRDRESAPLSGLWGGAAQKLSPAAIGSMAVFDPIVSRLPRARQAEAAHPVSYRTATNRERNVIPGEGDPAESLRIIWAIAAKDIRAAIHNKLALSIFLGAALLVVNGSILPMLLGVKNIPTAYVYDEGRSSIIRGLIGRQDFRLRLAESHQAMEEAVVGASTTAIGLVIPSDFDQMAGSDQGIELQGYMAHWADPEKASQWATFFEEQLGQANWSTVKINLENQVLYPELTASGQFSITLLTLIVVLMTVGLALVPLLFIEEREAHTMAALLVSPASMGQVVAGKALVGVFYCLVAAAVVFLLNGYLFVHWGVALMAVLLSAAFVVSLGLVVGFLSDTPSATSMWGGLLIVLLVGLTVLQAFQGENWPVIIQRLLDWQPGSAMLRLFQISIAGDIPVALLWANAAALLTAAGVIYAVILGLLRRADR